MINYKLKAARVERNKGQEFMAELLGVTIPTYSNKECGRREFKTTEVEKISNEFNLTPDQIKDIFFTNKVNANNKSA